MHRISTFCKKKLSICVVTQQDYHENINFFRTEIIDSKIDSLVKNMKRDCHLLFFFCKKIEKLFPCDFIDVNYLNEA